MALHYLLLSHQQHRRNHYPASLPTQVQSFFSWLQQLGQIPEADLWHTFNLGVGFVLVLPEVAVAPCLELISSLGMTGWPLGEVEIGPAGVAGLPNGA